MHRFERHPTPFTPMQVHRSLRHLQVFEFCFGSLMKKPLVHSINILNELEVECPRFFFLLPLKIIIS